MTMTPDRLPDLLPRMSAAEVEAHRALARLTDKWRDRNMYARVSQLVANPPPPSPALRARYAAYVKRTVG